MIISASRRTDIPAFYAPWFFNRLQEGYLLVPNPFDPRTLSRISLGRDVVDCIVFWTKNPAPMLPRLGELSGYNYYFQYTLNPYDADLEKHLPPLERRIETFKRLSDKVGRDRVVWRYDPILTNAACDVDFHCESFARIAHALRDHTTTCMLGFIDHYRHIRGILGALGIGPLQRDEIQRMAVSFRRTAASTPIALKTCTARSTFGTWASRPACASTAGWSNALRAIRSRRRRMRTSAISAIASRASTSAPMKAV